MTPESQDVREDPKPPTKEVRLEGIEFNGYMVLSDRTLLSLFDRKTQKCFWLGMGETKHGVRLESFDLGKGRVTVVGGSVSRAIPLKKSEIETLRFAGAEGRLRPVARNADVVRLERAAEDELIVSMSVSQGVAEERQRALKRKRRQAAQASSGVLVRR